MTPTPARIRFASSASVCSFCTSDIGLPGLFEEVPALLELLDVRQTHLLALDQLYDAWGRHHPVARPFVRRTDIDEDVEIPWPCRTRLPDPPGVAVGRRTGLHLDGRKGVA